MCNFLNSLKISCGYYLFDAKSEGLNSTEKA